LYKKKKVKYDAATAIPACVGLSDRSDVVSCFWSSASVVEFVLSYCSSLAVGDLFAVGGGVLPLFSPFSSPSAPALLPVQAPSVPVAPLVSISVPSRASSFILLDASGSSNLAGRPALSWSWAVSSPALVPPALDAAVRLARSSVLQLDALLIGPAMRRFAFQATATSWLNLTASSPLTVVLWNPLADLRVVPHNVRVLGPAVIATSAAAAFVLQVKTLIVIVCFVVYKQEQGTAGEPVDGINVDYAWYPTVDSPFVAPSIDRVLADTKNLAYRNLSASSSPYLLRYAVTYEAIAANSGGAPVSLLVVPAQCVCFSPLCFFCGSF
jgi:hypothetical protein